MALILVNVIWIAIEVDHNKADILCQAAPVFQIVDNLFCFCFSFEIAVRLLAFNRKSNAFRDMWFVFDAFLVSLMPYRS